MTKLSHVWPTTAALVFAGVPAQALECGTPSAPRDPAACAYEAFETANAEQAASIRARTAGFTPAQRQRWRAAQKAWIGWRTAECAFESGDLAEGSARQVVRWQCVARLTRERTEAIERLDRCPADEQPCPERRP